jgi:flagellar biosynthesis/type III secretory pathway protein FliH
MIRLHNVSRIVPETSRIVPGTTNSSWIVRAETVESHHRADDIIAKAERQAARLRGDAAEEAARAREAACREGLEEGKAAALALIAEVSSALDSQAVAREAEISRLAFAVAHRILGEFPEEERLVRAVTTALDEQRGAMGLRLRLSPKMESVLRPVLDQRDDVPPVTIEVDEGASADTCTMIHPRGRIAVGPLDQLQAFRAAAGAERDSTRASWLESGRQTT